MSAGKGLGNSIDHGDLSALGAHIESCLPEAVVLVSVSSHGELTIVARREHVLGTLKFARDDSQCRFESLIDICGVDYPDRPQRFEVVYHLLSMRMNQRLRIRIAVGVDESVDSATVLFPAAGWFEREAFDMYGINFSGHPDMRRILTDYGFDGFPLRKDFPLSGHIQVRYDPDRGRIVQEPVRLNQEYRDFDFAGPWEGLLPGKQGTEHG